MSAGIVDLKHDLMPGGFLESPRVFVGLSSEDLDATCRSMFDYLSKHVFPSKPPNFPWVVYDIWGTEKENVEKMILDEINIPVYKRFRHLLAEDCYHLTPPSGSAEGWQAVEFCKSDGSEA
ncbi:MAG: hypothetical protein L0312_10940, partial [Acidobacteria bacterium]|nr:hypothetical protein [Acidobacteriota bacterium]